jgi:hypothetical protein
VRLQFAEHDLATISRVLAYLYTGDYNDQAFSILASPITSALNDTTNTLNNTNHDQSGRSATKPSQQHLLDLGEEEKPADYPKSAPTLENLKIYFCADLLSIEPLKAVALQKFHTICRKSFPPPGFAEALTFTYARTANEHLELRTTVTRLCMERLPKLKKERELVYIVKTHEPVAWNLVEISANLEESRKLSSNLPASKELGVQGTAKVEGLRTKVRGLLAAHERDRANIQKLRSERDTLLQEKLLLQHEVEDLRQEPDAKVKDQPLATQLRFLRTQNERQQRELKVAEKAKAETQRSADSAFGRLKRAEKALMAREDEYELLLDRLRQRAEQIRKCRICWTEYCAPLDLEELNIDCGNCEL